MPYEPTEGRTTSHKILESPNIQAGNGPERIICVDAFNSHPKMAYLFREK